MNIRGFPARRRFRIPSAAYRRALETLEPRVLLSGTLFYVNDNWHITTDVGPAGLSAGDAVDNSGTGDDGALHGLVFGSRAFDSLSAALALAQSGDRVVVVSGSYSQSVTIAAGVSVEGWPYFVAASALPAANPDPVHLTQSSLIAYPTLVSGAQWTLNDAAAADTISIHGCAFTTLPTSGAIHATAGNAATVTVAGNSFADTGTQATGIQIDAAGGVDLSGNSFSGVYAAIRATGARGNISGNTITGARRGITVAQASKLSIDGNTISGLTSALVAGVAIVVDSPGGAVTVNSNHLTLTQNCYGIALSNSGDYSVTIANNVIDQGALMGLVGIVATDNGAGFDTASGPVQASINGNQISGAEFGIGLDGSNYFGATADVFDNTLAGDPNGIYLQGAATASISANLITGASIGIDVENEGGGIIDGNTIGGSSTGILFNSDAPCTISNSFFNQGSPNLKDLDIALGDQLVFAGGDHFAAVHSFVYNETATDFYLPSEDFGTTNPAAIAAKIHDQLDDPTLGLITWSLAAPANAVTGRFVFYKDSAFDTGGHDHAIATDKTPLLPGSTATFANYTSYDQGLGGLMVDISGSITLAPGDITFAAGNDNSPGLWPAVTATPAITVRPGAGVGGANRIEISFPDGAITDTWLQVTVHAGTDTGLAADDVFYFGNAIGESGTDPASARVDALDALAARAYAQADGPATPVPITNPLDYNRDGVVNAADEAVALTHGTSFLDDLQLISPPVPAAPAVAAISSRIAAAAAPTPATAPARAVHRKVDPLLPSANATVEPPVVATARPASGMALSIVPAGAANSVSSGAAARSKVHRSSAAVRMVRVLPAAKAPATPKAHAAHSARLAAKPHAADSDLLQKITLVFTRR